MAPETSISRRNIERYGTVLSTVNRARSVLDLGVVNGEGEEGGRGEVYQGPIGVSWRCAPTTDEVLGLF